MALSIGSKVGLGVAFALAVLVLVGVVSYRSTVQLVDTTYRVTHTYQVLESLERLMGAAADAETGVRGYVISGAEEFLEPYGAARRETGRTLASLRALAADNPDQLRRVDELERRLADSFEWLDGTARLRREAGLAASVERIRSGDGKAKTDGLRALIDQMEREERALLSRRSSAASATARQAVGIIVVGTVLALVFLVSGGLVINREIRGRQQAEARIRASEARYRALFDQMPVGLFRTAPDGRILDANPAMAQMLGYPDVASLEAVSAPALYLDPEERERRLEHIARVGLLKDFEVQLRRADGVPIWARSSVRAIHGPDGGVVAYEGAAEDVTETRRVQQALVERTRALEAAQEELVRKERLAILGQLAGGVSHELRNPLGVIKNSVYYLRMVTPEDDRVRKHLQILEREVASATRIVTDLLDFARTTPPVRLPVDLNEVVREVLDRTPLPATVRVNLALAEALPPLAIDRHQVGLVLGNLVRNAAQAMPEGGVLTIRTAAAEDGPLVAVEDTGPGIPPERIEKIFEPLYTTKAKGIGLGLAVAKSLADANGGRILVESEPGRGSCFTVRFAHVPEEG
jgi:PAS domain S-box-containing protein